jgi:hypothetical protein
VSDTPRTDEFALNATNGCVAPSHGRWSSFARQLEREIGDGERYRFLCMNPDWHFVERLCLESAGKSYAEFKAELDAAIDRRRALAAASVTPPENETAK